ncbi:pilus assembly protein TadG-related protein [Bordetella petrii]|uniref:pilus assembly protein TadG-related protein n=1 Tax=Bordetella petrii TaxID=94624 RepID=UPI001E4BBC5D|nr:pilus assembly protein TadG-related protein [Bordetella petrii]MCD0505385.1 pilus assembly protein TadG-related protein [Bordetella petrii]
MPAPSGQRGSIAISAAFAVLIGMVVLLSVQVGYLFYMKRELQKAADLAALSAVQVLAPTGAPSDCAAGSPVTVAAQASAVANVPGFVDTVTAADVTVDCKYWDPTRADAGGMHLFEPDAATGGRVNAVRVRIDKTLSALIPSVVGDWVGGTRASVVAVASNTAPTAAFSVESRLLRLASDGLLGKLLATLGATPNQLTVLDSAGLVNLDVTPSGLLQQLGLPLSVLSGIGTPEELAALDAVSLGDLLNATLAVAQRTSGTAQAQVGLLANIINVMLDVAPLDIPIKLFGDGGLLDAHLATDAQSALQADIKVIDLLQTSLMIANGDNLINLGLDVPILGVQSRVRVVEPPSIAVGGVGTRASTAGVRVYLRLKTESIPVVGPLLSTLGTKVDLPLIIEAGQSDATLTALCQAPLTPQQATFDVRSSVANVCLGKFPAMDPSNDETFFSRTNACIEEEFTSVQRHQVLNVLGILPLTSRVALPVFRAGTPVSVTLTEPPSPDANKTVVATDLDLAATAADVTDAVVGGILGDLLGSGTSLNAQQRKELAAQLVGPSANGRSITQVVNELQWSRQAMDTLGQRMSQGGLTGVLGGTLQVVGNVLGSLLSPVLDIGCGVGGLFGNLKQCRIDTVADLVLNAGGNSINGLLSVVVALLEPLLDPLSALLQNLLNLLGLNLGETDVSLLSVDCGKPRLVY